MSGERQDRGARFSARVGARRPDGCEPWSGQVSARTGSGLFYDDDNRQRSAQRVRWELAHGPLPARASVTQHCGTATCVRLEHLRLGRARRGDPEPVRAVASVPARGPVPASVARREAAAVLQMRNQSAIDRARLLVATASGLTASGFTVPGSTAPGPTAVLPTRQLPRLDLNQEPCD